MQAIVQDTYGSAEVLQLGTSRSPRSASTRCWSASARPASTRPTGRS